MSKFKRPGSVLLLFAWLLSTPLPAALTQEPRAAAAPQPAVHLGPDDVVRIVVTALANNDEPYADAGIATTFAFASPANKVSTGPLDRFTRMVKGEVYGIMVNHASSEFSEVVYEGNNAYQMVQLTAPDGNTVVFAFRLSKQLDGEFRNMWMTDAVWPVAGARPVSPGF
jgi:hypothetical protein